MPTLSSLDWKARQVLTDVGVKELYSAEFKHNGETYHLYDVSPLFPDKQHWLRPRSEVTGFAWHHDGVFYNGETIDAEFKRLRAIYDYHVAQGWNGIGYHAVQGRSNRIYLPRTDVLDTHRAHVSMSKSSGAYRFPKLGDPVWNRQLIGYCIMGDFTQQGYPPQVMRSGADAFFRLVTDTLGQRMTLHPHSYYQHKPCPGTWATPDSWSDIVYEPEAKTYTRAELDKAVRDSYNEALQKVEAAVAALRRARQ